MEPKDSWSIVIATLAIINSIALFYFTKLFAKRTNSIPAMIDYLGEWRKPGGIKESYYFIIHNFSEEEKKNDKQFTLGTIPDINKKNHAREVSHYFDNLGLLVYSGVLDEEYLISFVGGNANKAWGILKQFILAQRQLNKLDEFGDRHYQRHFEYFAALYKKRYEKLNKKLDRMAKKMQLEE